MKRQIVKALKVTLKAGLKALAEHALSELNRPEREEVQELFAPARRPVIGSKN